MIAPWTGQRYLSMPVDGGAAAVTSDLLAASETDAVSTGAGLAAAGCALAACGAAGFSGCAAGFFGSDAVLTGSAAAAPAEGVRLRTCPTRMISVVRPLAALRPSTETPVKRAIFVSVSPDVTTKPSTRSE